MSLCKHCISGVRHEGVAEGKTEKIGGINCYIATPAGDYPKEKAVLFCTDAFGYSFINNQLLADDYARNGFKVIMPDIYNGEPVPLNTFDPGSTFDLPAWKARHPPDEVTAIVHTVAEALKADGVGKLGALGFCYGALIAFNLACTGEVDVVAVAHPTLVEPLADLEKYLQLAKAPLLINSCEFDEVFPHTTQTRADELFGDGKFAPGYERTYWEGCTHGFAVRGDLSDPKVKAGKEGAFVASVEFLMKYL